ncbi:tetratricopeptide repeat protein [Roseinatronobacter bogoriensis subsp. barguzinensis]|uniref:Tetratricopeptide repeat protein n=1 Tax=Roseinatronobacter bogoriensis subsp. barguzinensis TaxID=441209 RepID=A0A2K8KFZ7_9RHOB|nr:tetratricopeptide repeat protein [Rhodobaca barguzinensis]
MLAACTGAGQNSHESLIASAGPDQLGPQAGRVDVIEAVDGLIVGHRAMAAGEYEIALRAYHRAAGSQGATVDVLSAIGSANLRLGRLQQAEQDLRRALELDETFVPAHNNLGVVLAEQGKWGEASLHFRNAFAFDSGRSAEIRDNLRLAIENSQQTGYGEEEALQLLLMRRGSGRYLLLSTPL